MDRYTPAIQTKQSVHSLEKVMLNHVEQWILLRGENTDLPLLLFLHGGPGNAQIGWAPHFQTSLEKDFIVVNWDQRGSGLSYNERIPEESMDIASFVNDAHELIVYLFSRFNKEKLFIVGHSWGSIIGMTLAHKFPDLIHAYIGVGQSVHLQRGELLSYEFTADYAKRNNLDEAMSELQAIGRPPYKTLDDLFIQRKWLADFGGVVFKDRQFFRRMGDIVRNRPEYKESDIEKLRKGNFFSMKTMWDEVMTVDMPVQIKQVNCPVYFLLGEYDYNTPNSLVHEFYHGLAAPRKKVIFFSNVAHNLPFEDPELFHKTVYDISVTHTT